MTSWSHEDCDEQAKQLEAWRAERPEMPKSERPQKPNPDYFSWLFIAMIAAVMFFFLGADISARYWISGETDWLMGGYESYVWFLFPSAFMSLAVVAALVVRMIVSIRYRHQMRDTGWADYDKQHHLWAKSGEERFSEWCETSAYIREKYYRALE